MGRAHRGLSDQPVMAQAAVLLVGAHQGRHLVVADPTMDALPVGALIAANRLEGRRMGRGAQQWL
ncbi:MAG TPA: hypothetical protein VH599_18210 [Ktedonobacterales bacterium]